MKFFDTQKKAFALIGIHGGRLETKWADIDVRVGTDENGDPIISNHKYPMGTHAVDVPVHWLAFEDDDPRFGSHQGKRLVYVDGVPEDSEDYGDLVLEDIPNLTPEQTAIKDRQARRAERSAAVKSIKVTVDGMEFDGDEVSQERMSRAFTAADNDGEQTYWTLADNTVAIVTANQLKQALRLSAQAQAQLWAEYAQ